MKFAFLVMIMMSEDPTMSSIEHMDMDHCLSNQRQYILAERHNDDAQVFCVEVNDRTYIIEGGLLNDIKELAGE